MLQASCPVRGPIHISRSVSRIGCALQAHDERNFTAVWVFKPKRRTFRVYRQFDVISSAMTNRRDAFVMVPPAGGYETAVYSAELAPCKKVKFDAATLPPSADELDPPQPETPPKNATVKVGFQTAQRPQKDLQLLWIIRSKGVKLWACKGAQRDMLRTEPKCH